MYTSLDKSRILKHPPKVIRLGIGDDELPGSDQPVLMAHPRKRGLWKSNVGGDHGFFNLPMRDRNGARRAVSLSQQRPPPVRSVCPRSSAKHGAAIDEKAV
jgi:hypothetical protein